MASIEAVAAGFIVKPTKGRERQYVGYLVEKGESAVPIDGALYALRPAESGEYVMLLPLRSFDAAKRIAGLFEALCKAHQNAVRSRGTFKVS